MSKTFRRINDLGFVVEEGVTVAKGQSVTSDLISEDVPIGISVPRWDSSRWVEGMYDALALQTAEPTTNWRKLQDTLRGSIAFGRAMATSNTNAWALLLFALGTSHSVDDLNFAIAQVRSGMSSDFTAEEIEFINTALSDSGFDLRLE